MPYAPILISVYSRLEYLRQLVNLLKINPISQYSVLYIVSDAAYRPLDQPKIDAVRTYISQIDGFQRIIPILREKNLGSFLSVSGALDHALFEHGKCIFLEDDNIISKNFLDFLNDGLDFYRDEQSVFSVSAYNYPIQVPETYAHDVYKWQGFSAWGAGLWLDRWRAVDWEMTGFNDLAQDKYKRRKLALAGEHLYPMIVHYQNRGHKIIDFIISYYMVQNNLYSIFPVESKVRNLGHDGTGEHSGITNLYANQSMDTGIHYSLKRDLQPDERINRILRMYFRIPMKVKILSKLSAILPDRPKKWLKNYFIKRPV